MLGGQEGWGGPRPRHSARHPPIADGAARRRLALPCPLAAREGCAAEGTTMAHQGGHPGRHDTLVRSGEPCLQGCSASVSALKPAISRKASSQEPQMLRARLKAPSAALHPLQLGPDLIGDDAVSSPLGTLLSLTWISANPWKTAATCPHSLMLLSFVQTHMGHGTLTPTHQNVPPDCRPSHPHPPGRILPAASHCLPGQGPPWLPPSSISHDESWGAKRTTLI